MKTDIYIEDPGINRIRSSKIDKNIKNINFNELNRAAFPEIIQNLSKKRTLIRAVIISQIAQGFFQNAMLISSRLKRIASEGILAGKINSAGFNNTLTGISSSLNLMKKEHPQIMQSLRYFMSVYQYNGASGTDLQINEELNIMKEFMNEFNTGKNPDLKRIDNIKHTLLNKETAVKRFNNQLADELSISGGLYGIDEKYSNLSADIGGRIIEFPQDALISQGNITHEAVRNLI